MIHQKLCLDVKSWMYFVQVEHKNYLYQFCLDLETDLRWSIQETSTSQKTLDSFYLTSLVHEALAHLHHLNDVCDVTVERRSILSEIKSRLRSSMTLDNTANEGHPPIVLHGEQGVGKTCVMARLHSKISHWFGSDCVRVTRFVGITHNSSHVFDLVLSLAQQIAHAYSITLPRDLQLKSMSKLASIFLKLLRRVSAQPQTRCQPLFILLDNLDALSSLYNAHNPTWLPSLLPEHVYLIVSVTQSSDVMYSRLKAHIKSAESFVPLQGFSVTSASSYVDLFVTSRQRRVTAEQRQTILNMARGAENSPLYMWLILSQAVYWDASFAPSELALGKTASAAAECIVTKLMTTHGRTLTSFTLAYITIAQGCSLIITHCVHYRT